MSMQTKGHSSFYLYYIFSKLKNLIKISSNSLVICLFVSITLFKSLKFDCLSFSPIFSVH